MRTTKFTIDAYGETEFAGYTTDEFWNGWACPYFTREQAMKIVDAHNSNDNGKARYDEAADSFVFSYSDDEQDAFSVVNIEGQSLYPIGAFYWTWEESAAEGVSA